MKKIEKLIKGEIFHFNGIPFVKGNYCRKTNKWKCYKLDDLEQYKLFSKGVEVEVSLL